MKAVNRRVDKTNARLDALGVDLRAEMRHGFDALGARIDNLLTGAHGREHEDLRRRVGRLEERAGLPPIEPSPAR